MRRLLLYALLLFAALSTASCRRSVEKVARKIRFEGIEQVRMQGMSMAEVDARIDNGSAYRLTLSAARIDLYYADLLVGRFVLQEPVEIGRRTEASLQTRWRIQYYNLMYLYVMYRTLKVGASDQIAISFEIEGRGGPVPLRFSREKMPLSEFLTTFGLTVQDVQNCLKP